MIEMIKTYHPPKTSLAEDEVFVFTSNLDGFSGAGSAGYATFNEFGNVWRKYDYQNWPNGTKGKWNVKGKAEGPMVGTEGKSYAIPTVTKAGAKRSIPLEKIGESIKKFYAFAQSRPHLKFFVAQENKAGLNGYSPQEMASIYSGDIPENVYFADNFAPLLNQENRCFHESIKEPDFVNQIVHCMKGGFDRYIGRPQRGGEWGFGNPFVAGKDGPREEVIKKFARWITYGDNCVNNNATPSRRQWILDHAQELEGKILGCWCHYPKEDCHGRVLLELARNLK